jgi:hypothetical protein
LALLAARGVRVEWRVRDGGDDLLGEDVERVAQEAGGFDVAFVHGARDGGAGDEVGAVLGEDDAVRGGADLVAGAADALHAAGDAGRRFDLDDEVDCAHVDAEFERGGGDEGLDLAGLEQLFDLDALRGGERAVVGAGDGFAGELVESSGEALGDAAGVDEDEVEVRLRMISSRRGWMLARWRCAWGLARRGRWATSSSGRWVAESPMR